MFHEVAKYPMVPLVQGRTFNPNLKTAAKGPALLLCRSSGVENGRMGARHSKAIAPSANTGPN